MLNKIKLGILGLGEHCVRSHLDYLSKINDVEFFGSYDPDSTKKYSSIQHYFSSEEELFKSKEINAVLIMTPDKFHAESSLKALKAGKHVLCEKPLATNQEEINMLYEAINFASQNNLIFTSCHPRRFDKCFIWLKNHISEYIKLFGQILNFSFDFSYHKPSKSNLHQGLMMDHLNHEIDLMTFLFGFSSFSILKINDSQTRYEVAGQRNDDNISFYFSGSRKLENKIYPEFCKIRFERGDVNLNTYSGQIVVYDHDQEIQTIICGNSVDYNQRFNDLNRYFINSIKGLEKNYLSSHDLIVNTATGIDLQADNQSLFSSVMVR